MIFFNDPIPLETPAEHTVRTRAGHARSIREVRGRLAQGRFDLHIGIGIARRYTTIGAIGF